MPLGVRLVHKEEYASEAALELAEYASTIMGQASAWPKTTNIPWQRWVIVIAVSNIL